MPHKFVVLSALLWVTTSAQAASFNCADARTPVELRICANPTLSTLDDQLAKAYSAAQKSGLDAKSTQRLWLRERNKCVDDDCIQGMYEARIRELTGAQASSAAPNPESAPSPLEGPSVTASALPLDAPVVAPAEAAEPSAPAVAAPPEPTTPEVLSAKPSEVVTAESPSIIVTRDIPKDSPSLLSSVMADIRNNYAYVLLGLAALAWIIVHGYKKRCPKCEKWFAAEEVDHKLLGKKMGVKTVTRHDKHRDAKGQTLKTVERQEQVQVEVSTWKDFYKCTKCQHEWTGVSQTERT